LPAASRESPLFDACGPIYDAAMALGFGSADTASLCEVLARSRRRGRRSGRE